MGIRKYILDHIENALNQITIASGYSTDISTVRVDNIIYPGKAGQISNREYVVQLELASETTANYDLGSDQLPVKSMVLNGLITTFNQTYAQTTDFIDDIEEAIVKEMDYVISTDVSIEDKYSILDWDMTNLVPYNIEELNTDRERAFAFELHIIYQFSVY